MVSAASSHTGECYSFISMETVNETRWTVVVDALTDLLTETANATEKRVFQRIYG